MLGDLSQGCDHSGYRGSCRQFPGRCVRASGTDALARKPDKLRPSRIGRTNCRPAAIRRRDDQPCVPRRYGGSRCLHQHQSLPEITIRDDVDDEIDG